jgi:metallo-beta-lactamase class B
VKKIAFALLIFFSVAAFAQADPVSRSWNQPVEPFRIIGNVYYVGASDVTSFLIATPEGHILLDSGFKETVPQILQNIPKLGFKVEDVKILLNSHAHQDHAGGLALLKQLTGARLIVSRGDQPLLARGGLRDPNFGDTMRFDPVRADRLIDDGATVKLGGATVTALLTPGHTPGCTTWTMKVPAEGKSYNVLFACSASSPGYQLVGNRAYPNIVEDYQRTFRILESLQPDVFLAAHGGFFGLQQKIQAMKANPEANPFIESSRYRAWLKGARQDFEKKLAEQSSTAPR